MSDDTQLLTLIKMRSESGVLQSEARGLLGFDSKKCSRVVSRLIKENLIKRLPEVCEGRNTFRLILMPEKDESGIEKRYYKMLAQGVFSPCTGCKTECVPQTCPFLDKWVQLSVMD